MVASFSSLLYHQAENRLDFIGNRGHTKNKAVIPITKLETLYFVMYFVQFYNNANMPSYGIVISSIVVAQINNSGGWLLKRLGGFGIWVGRLKARIRFESHPPVLPALLQNIPGVVECFFVKFRK